MTTMTNRRCAYAQAAILDDDGNHMVAMVDEGESGFWPTTYTGTLDYCEGVAESINNAYGLTRRDVLDIVSSSMAARA